MNTWITILTLCCASTATAGPVLHDAQYVAAAAHPAAVNEWVGTGALSGSIDDLAIAQGEHRAIAWNQFGNLASATAELSEFARLIELPGKKATIAVRVAAHVALEKMLEAAAAVKDADAGLEGVAPLPTTIEVVDPIADPVVEIDPWTNALDVSAGATPLTPPGVSLSALRY